eukprot:5578239-Pleurochrysis_carterae.AAC.1
MLATEADADVNAGTEEEGAGSGELRGSGGRQSSRGGATDLPARGATDLPARAAACAGGPRCRGWRCSRRRRRCSLASTCST